MRFFLRKRTIYLIILFAIFLGLFYFLKDKVLFTPDFIGDAYHGDISSKLYLSEIYKKNLLPFWTDKLAGGYPIIADNLSGSLFLPNIIILKFFPFNIGYNLLFLTALFSIAAGFFLILTEFRINNLLSLLLSLNFTFNASITLRLIHLTVIQPFSLFPLLFFLLYAYFKNNQKIYFYLSIFIASQIIYAGHPQVAFTAFFSMLIFLFAYLISLKNTEPKEKIYNFFIFLVILILAFYISLPQILPTLKLHQFLKRSPNLNFQEATAYGFSWSNFVNFFSPFVFGNPKVGSYNFFTPSHDIFWENTPYIGKWLSFLMIFVVLYVKILVRKIDKNYQRLDLIFLSLFIVFILFSLGKNSPIYFIFSFPPFSYFRNQSRYLLFAVFFLYLFISSLFNQAWKTKPIAKIVLVIILTINLFDLVNFAYDYHLLIDYKKVFQAPAIATKMDVSKYINLDQGAKWNNTFLNSGWSTKTAVEDYLFFRNYLFPNSGLIFSKSSFNMNSPVTTFNRVNIFQNLILSNINSSDTNNYYFPSKTKELVKLIGIKYFITSNQINDKDFKLDLSLPHRDIKINLYRFIRYSNNFFYIPKTLKKITYLEEFNDLFDKGNNFESLAIYEDSALDELSKNTPKKLKLLASKFTENQISLSGEFSDETLLVVKKNYYPEWKAYIDGKETKIYPVNLIHIGVIIPAGKHKLTISYQPVFFEIGLYVALLTLILLFIFHNRKKLNLFQRS